MDLAVAQVKAAEEGRATLKEDLKPTSSGNMALTYNETLLDIPVTLSYSFKNDKLVMGLYQIQKKYPDRGGYIDDFHKLKYWLIKKYGTPDEEATITSDHKDSAKHGFKGRFRELKAGDALVENIYTFEKYRGKKIMSSVLVRIANSLKQNGFKRMLAYIRQNNIDSLQKTYERIGFQKFEEILERKLFFFCYTRTVMAKSPNHVPLNTSNQ